MLSMSYPLLFSGPYAILESFYEESSIRQIMKSKGYAPIATNLLTTLYINTKSKYYRYIKNIGEFEEES